MTPQEKQQLAWLQAPEQLVNEAPARLTPVTAREVAKAFRGAWETLFGATPSNAALALLLAQSALETGRWRSVWCNNLGNSRPGKDRSVLCMQIPGGKVSEVIGGKEHFFEPPSRGSTFRAFESLEAGAVHQLDLLRHRFITAWPHLLNGDPREFVIALKRQGYFTAQLEPYVRAVTSLFREYLRLLADEPEPDEVPDTEPSLEELRRTVEAQQFPWFELLDDSPDEPPEVA